MVSLRDTSSINQWKRLKEYESPMLVTDLYGLFFLCRLHLSRMISISSTPSTDSGFFSNSTTPPPPYHSIPSSPVPPPLVVELNSRDKFRGHIYKDTQRRGLNRNPILYLPMAKGRILSEIKRLSAGYPMLGIKCFRRWRFPAGLPSTLYAPLGFILSPNTEQYCQSFPFRVFERSVRSYVGRLMPRFDAPYRTAR